MSFYKQYTSPLGYVSNGNPIDTYGVDHSGFTIRDELAYQTARINRENDLMTQMNNQGITSYPQYTTNFWGTNADNNYGFGTSNIGNNIENRQQTMSPVPQRTTQPSTSQVQPRYWENAVEGKQVYGNVVRNEGNHQPQEQNMLNYGISAIQGGIELAKNFPEMSKMKVSDKYKHAFMNCSASQYGQGGADVAKLASDLREWNDIRTGANSLDSSQGDNYANLIGRLLGSKYPNGDCNELIQNYIKKNL